MTKNCDSLQKRHSGRAADEIRNLTLDLDVSPHAEGSCLIKCGNTHVLCTASVDEHVPPFLRNKGTGWVTAEYGMLPRSTHSRMRREASAGKQGARTQEIQRLIGRSLRAAVDLEQLGERQIIVDCDVINADGGTRTAAITGGYVALYSALSKLVARRVIRKMPLISQVAAISCGIINGKPVVDLDYIEDSNAEVDANFVMESNGNIIEVQATAEGKTFSQAEFIAMLELAQNAIDKITLLQNELLMKDLLAAKFT